MARAVADAARGAVELREVSALVAGAVQRGRCTVEQLAAETAKTLGSPVAIRGFVRFALGEGVDKKTDDFAAEVAALSKA